MLAKRLGPLSVLAAIALCAVSRAAAGVSPGPLARSHQKLDSVLECTTCHGTGSNSMNDRCLACHREISWLVGEGRGLHATEKHRECVDCHKEHRGLDAAIAPFEEGDPERFDHRRTGWTTEGKHARVKCRDCHKPALQRSEAARISKREDRENSFIGLERSCASCHPNPHRGATVRDCAGCHDLAGWKPARGFDHARTRYPLTGAHERVVCLTCHRPPEAAAPAGANTHAVPDFDPLRHDDCGACHADPHAGRLGAPCSRCHVTESFRRVAKTAFSHDVTRYPLRGRHVLVDCARCHDPLAPRGTKPPFETCGACHRDPHSALATIAGKKADCAACHGVEGFRPSTFTVAQHQASAFPLAGKHAQAKCGSCHPRGAGEPEGYRPGATVATPLRPPHARCGSCHADAHSGQLAGLPEGADCASCHTVESFRPTTFTEERHRASAYPLEGKHLQVKCEGCHPRDPLAAAGYRPGAAVSTPLRPPHVRCGSCHPDAHGGQLAARPEWADCGACHRVDGWKPSTFTVKDHAALRFALEGKHATAECATCHGPNRKAPPFPLPAEALGKAKVALSLGVQACSACHATPHGNQFEQRADRGACDGCHDARAFRPASRFVHDRDSAFALRGAHARLACSRCHVPKPGDGAGTPATVYRPLPRDCKGCHVPRPPVQSEGAASRP